MRKAPIIGAIIQVAAAAVCGPCGLLMQAVVAGVTSGVLAGITTGSLSAGLRAGFISFATAMAFNAVGNATAHGTLKFGDATHLANVAGHAAVGCASAMASGGTPCLHAAASC